MVWQVSTWVYRVQTVTDKESTRPPDSNRASFIAMSSSARNGVVGLGAAIKTRKHVGDERNCFIYFRPKNRTESICGELAEMAHALEKLSQCKYPTVVLHI